MDDTTPRTLRIAGGMATVREIAGTLSALSGRPYKPFGVGGIRTLDFMIGVTKLLAPQKDETFPPWQGMQYMRDMFSGDGKLHPLDNARYPGLRWTSVEDHLAQLGHW